MLGLSSLPDYVGLGAPGLNGNGDRSRGDIQAHPATHAGLGTVAVGIVSHHGVGADARLVGRLGNGVLHGLAYLCIGNVGYLRVACQHLDATQCL